MTMVRTLFFLATAFLALNVAVNAAPARYDQRQDGNLNVHAQLENFLFVVAIPSNNDLLGDLALQALELKQQLVSRASSLSREKNSIKADEEPYSLEIIRINENQSNKKEDTARKAEEEKTGTFDVSNQRLATIGEAEKPERIPKNLKAFEFPKSREVPTTIMGYLADVRKMLQAKTENNGRARNVVDNAWNSEVESDRLGTSDLKKEGLLHTEAEDVATSSANKNDVIPSIEKKQEELRLLGDGIENCGPGRHRDASGICQPDDLAGSPL